MLAFGEYKPDVSDANASHTKVVNNVVPHADGYGPFNAPEAFTSALAARCRGFFFAVNPSNGTIAIFAGTATKLYQLNNNTFNWSDVSQGAGTYTTIDADAQWVFSQFGQNVVAVQNNAAPQVFNITSSSEFADLGGSPPNCGWCAVVNNFLVLADLASNPNRVQWSALGDITGWTSGTDYSDFQDLPDGGSAKAVVGGQLGVIVQENAVRRMIYQPGSEVVFSVDRIANNVGTPAKHSVTYVNDNIFWLSKRGFVKANAAGEISFIGRERVDRTFLKLFDDGELGLVIGAADPSSHLVLFTYKSASSGDGTAFDKVLAYDWLIDRWSPIDQTGEYIAPISQPGFTLETLETIGQVDVTGAADNGAGLVRLTVDSTAGWTTGIVRTVRSVGGTTEANGTWVLTVVDATHIDLQGSSFSNAYTTGGYVAGSVDDLGFSLDSVSPSTLPALAVCDTDSKIGFFTGAAKAATLETAELGRGKRGRTRSNGFEVLTDAPTVTGNYAVRESLQATPTDKTSQSMNSRGYVPNRANGRFIRGKISIAAGIVWTFATGIDMDPKRAGKR